MEKKIVILMHNFAFEEAQNKVRLFKFIEGLKRRGYKFETVATLAVTEKPDDYVYEEYWAKTTTKAQKDLVVNLLL